MHFRLKIGLLLVLMGTAAFAGAEALQRLRPATDADFPEELYARFARNADSAAFFLRQEGGYVAVYAGRQSREPLRVTGIELDGLRKADRAMIREGLPVRSFQELLQLLEDLGS